MLPTDPQIIYIILVLPTLFGLTLVGEGLNKVVFNHEKAGFISLIFGIAFICLVVFAVIFISTYLGMTL